MTNHELNVAIERLVWGDDLRAKTDEEVYFVGFGSDLRSR